MKKIFRNKILWLLAIIILSFYLRSNNLTVWPRQGATFDEYAWTWLGINLINERVPQSWSPHPQYEGKAKNIIFQQTHFRLVKPYLEHPPFFGIVAGAFAKANGVNQMFDITIAKIRPLGLLLGVVSVFMLFLLVKQVYGTNLALLSTLIFSVVPTIAVGSRIVQNENFFIPMFLSSTYFIAKYLATNKKKFLYASALLCGLLAIAKVPWLACALGVCLVLWYKKKYREIGVVLIITSLFFMSYILYGLYFDKDLFLNLWSLQLNRYALTFNSVFALFTEPYLVDRYYIDGWIYFGWFAFFLLLASNLKKHFLIVLPLMAYFAVFVFAIPNEAGHGWYRYPFYPFLAVSIALFIREHFNKNLLLTALFILLVGLSMLEQSWTRALGFSFPIFRGFILLVAFSVLPIFIDSPRLKRISSLLNYCLLGVIFLLSIWSVLLYNEQ